jgi:hypothetical protein
MKHAKVCVAVLACLTWACAMRDIVKMTMIGPPGPAKPAFAPVQVFITTPPDRPYTEIAEFIFPPRGNSYTQLDLILPEARKIGADAVIYRGLTVIPGFQGGASGNNSVWAAPMRGLKYVAIRWKE